MDKIKRDRSTNFTLNETNLLKSLAHKYKNILENNGCKASTWTQKEVAWKTIQNEFNAQSKEAYRSIKSLRYKYKSLKKLNKKSNSKHAELDHTETSECTVPLDPLKLEYSKVTQFDNSEKQMEAIMSSEDNSYDSVTQPQIIIEESQDQLQKSIYFDDLLQVRLETFKLKKRLLEEEIIEKKKEWEFNEKQRKWKEEEYKLKLQILKKQLN